MTDSMETSKACIIYFCREGYFSRSRCLALDLLKKNDGDTVLVYYVGIAFILEGQYQEGMRLLHPLQDDPEVMLGVMLALIHAHRCCKSIDKEALSKLETKLKEERRKARDKTLYYAGMFLFLMQRYDKAREYVDRMLKMNAASEGLVLKGWLEMHSSKENKDAKLKNVLEYFDTALGEGKNLDALLGKVKYFELRNNFSGALELLNQAVVTFPNEIPPLIEKMKIQLALQDWEQTLDIAKRILSSDSRNIEAKRHMILYYICVFRDVDMALKLISEWEEECRIAEPSNGHILCETAQLFSRVCAGHNDMLRQCQKMAERAVMINEENADFVTEVAKQLSLQGKMKEAVQHYKLATKLDESGIKALTGIIFCQLVEGHTDVAEQQLEFLKEIQKAVGVSDIILFLSAMLIRKKNGNALDALGYLGECVKAHFATLAGMPLGLKYYLNLDPDFLLLVVKEYLHYAPSQPLSPGQPIPALLYQAMLVLEPLTKSCSGLWEPFLFMAKIKYLTGDVKTASNLLQHVLQKLDSTSTECYLLLAKIQLHEGSLVKANQSLEMAVSCNFNVRDSPVYNLIKAQVQKRKGELEEAVKSLHTVMSLAGISPSRSRSARKSKMILTNTDKVCLHLELAETYQLLQRPHEATKVMQDAMMEFQGTPEEACITIANADLVLSKGDTEQALTMLRNIKADQTYYLQAREKMAYIYLHHRRDKRLFANCYREVVDKSPSLQAFLMLGDAYLSIQEPELAIEVYEQALKRNPRDSTLARKIGQALVKTHNYNKAINYYKEALKNESQSFLRYDLAELLMKMKQFEKAEKILTQAINNSEGNDLSSLINEVKNFMLLCKIYQKSGNGTGHIYALTKAKDAQVRVLKRSQVEQPDNLESQQQLTSSICRQMAEYSAGQKNYEGAIKLYKEALLHDENDTQAMIDLARLFMSIGDLESCQNVCSTLLANQPENEVANVMMADVMFRKNDYETALYHFKQVLDHKPDSYEAMGRFVEVMRRVGKLNDVCDFLAKAEKRSPRVLSDPGFNYCKGLYEWYTGGSNNALKSFNKARRDNVWGQKAIYNMIEICLNPNNDMLGSETFDSVEAVEGSGHDKLDFKDAALRTADKLIKELQPNPGDIQHVVLRSFLLLATKQKQDADKALNEFLQLANNELYRDNLLLILGMSTAYMILKQTPRARNQLKRVAKNNWNFEDAEYLERCWLLLADIYIQSGKYDMASELLKRVLEHNKSSCKAYEYMGYIMEKENSYKDASTNYEMAWKFGGQNNPAIGYKLAFNYMKAKRYATAIDVCHSVLEKFPNYPKIKKDILEKSRGNLRA